MKIGIVGCGISGAYLAYKLSKKHDVTVFEAKKKIGKKACSGLVSERLWKHIPKNNKLVKNKIKTIVVNFPKKSVTLDLNPNMLVLDHDKLDRYVAKLGKAKIKLNTPVTKTYEKEDKQIIVAKGKNYEFDYVIGADGPHSTVRKSIGGKEPRHNLGLFVYEKKKGKSSTVETWPIKDGFAWKIPRNGVVEYGLMAPNETASKEFKKFYKKSGKIMGANIPDGLVLTHTNKVALIGDAAGLTKPWSIDGDESVLIKKDGMIRNEKIKDVVRNSGRISALSPTKNLDTIDFFNVRNFLHHPQTEDNYEIVLKKGYRVKATASHSVITIDDYKLTSKKVSELIPGKDHLLLTLDIPNNQSLNKLNIKELILNKDIDNKERFIFKDKMVEMKGARITIPEVIEANEHLMRLLGYYIAEGDNHNGKEIHLSFGENDFEIIEDLKKCVKKTFGIQTSKTMKANRQHRNEETEFSVSFGGKLLSYIFPNIFETGIHSENKQIPWLVFNVPDELKLEFLKAYILGDGHSRIRMPEKRKNWSAEISVKTVSRKLVSDLAVLSFQLGLFPSIEENAPRKHTYRGKTVNSLKSYRMVFSRRCDIEKLLELIDNNKYKKYLEKSKVEKSTINLPKNLISKNQIYKIKDKTLRKYFFERMNSKSCKTLSYSKLEEVIKYFDKDRRIQFIEHLVNNKIVLLPVKKVSKIKSNGDVYDLEVPTTNMFVGGIGPIVLHNSGGGIIWSLQSADMLLKHFPSFDDYNKELKEFFEPRIFFSRIISKTGVFFGTNLPWLVPKEINFDSDWIF